VDKGFQAQKKQDYTGREGGIEPLIHFFIESLGLLAVRCEAAKIAR
jgi:hypothetical protein